MNMKVMKDLIHFPMSSDALFTNKSWRVLYLHFVSLVLILSPFTSLDAKDPVIQDIPVCPNHVDSRVLFDILKSKSKIMLGASTFQMGADPPVAIPGDGEAPLRFVKISKPFWIDHTEVTVQQFLDFVKATNYSTTAEYYGSSFSFWMEDGRSVEEMKQGRSGPWWWTTKEGLNWRNAGNNVHEKKLNRRTLPVNHVSWDDAHSFCSWVGGRLPTEKEWEYACRGGLNGARYSWGNELKINGSHMTNIWQGTFPSKNTKKDGFSLRAPVASFPCNQYGLHDMSGNVWEWVEGKWLENSENINPDVRVQKGGSYLCHRGHCYRYRCSARTKASRDSTASNVGFRCAYDMPKK